MTGAANQNKKNSTRAFFQRLFLLFTGVFILDFGIGTVLKFFYFKQESGAQYRTTFSIEKTDADILIFGSSRANHHYDPDIFEKGLGLSYYNAGRDGQFIFYHYAVLKAVLKRYSPKIVILDLSNNEFRKNKGAYDRLSALLPYYTEHPEIQEIVNLRGPYERLKNFSHIYPYNSLLFTIAVGNAEFNKKKKGDVKGYVALTKTYDSDILADTSSVIYEFDSLKVNAYRSFIKECANSKVKLYVVCSPYLIKSDHVDHSVRMAKEIAQENGIDFFDHSRDSVFLNNAKLFSDVAHLNREGAKVFSDILISRIKKQK